MARLTAFIVTLSLLSSALVHAGFFGRDKVVSRWTAKAPAVDGDDAEWDPAAALETDDFSFQAQNDATNLYLLITSHTREGREQLAGKSRQNLSLWFLRDDAKTRYWGALLPFSRRSPLTDALRDPSGVDPEPELTLPNGVSVSTAPWPAEVQDRIALSARRPVWELKIPLNRLQVGKGGTVAADFAVGPAAGSATAKTRADEVSVLMSVRLAPAPEAGR